MQDQRSGGGKLFPVTTSRLLLDRRELIETVRQACIKEALGGFEHASISGLCCEGAWEAAVSAIRSADLDVLAAGQPNRSDRCPAAPDVTLVRDIMTPEAATLRPGDKLLVAEDVMRLGRIRHLPVVDGSGRLCGIVSQRDLLRSALLEHLRLDTLTAGCPKAIHVSEVMTRKVVVARPDMPLRDAAARMFRRKLGCLPVVEGDKVVGIITESDFVHLAF